MVESKCVLLFTSGSGPALPGHPGGDTHRCEWRAAASWLPDQDQKGVAEPPGLPHHQGLSHGLHLRGLGLHGQTPEGHRERGHQLQGKGAETGRLNVSFSFVQTSWLTTSPPSHRSRVSLWWASRFQTAMLSWNAAFSWRGPGFPRSSLSSGAWSCCSSSRRASCSWRKLKCPTPSTSWVKPVSLGSWLLLKNNDCFQHHTGLKAGVGNPGEGSKSRLHFEKMQPKHPNPSHQPAGQSYSPITTRR